MTLREEVACAIYGEETLGGLGRDVQERMLSRADAAIALIVERCAGVAAGSLSSAMPVQIATAIRQLKGEQG